MGSIKSLAKDTMIYGVSSIVGRFLNWCLVPLYTNVFNQAEYGVVSYVYSIVAVALIILIYGMETGFFRFVNHERYPDPMVVYSTTLISLAVSSSVFFFGAMAFLHPISDAVKCGAHTSYVWMMAAVLSIDAFSAIPFSYLRFRHRPLRFASLKLVSIAVNIGLNIFFILICPWLYEQDPGLIAWFYEPDFGIGYIFLSNFISSLVVLLLLIPELVGFRYRFDVRLWREMVSYSFPLLILGIAGIMNQTLDKLLIPELISDRGRAMAELGVYSANYKIALVMVMFIQAFRFAYEPFIFSQNKKKGIEQKTTYSMAMKYFVIFAMVIFLAVMFYLDIIKYFIGREFFSGLKVVPIVMLAEFFFGIFFNLSLWYKLTDQTIWGTWFSLLGLAITIAGNVIMVPHIGYMGCAWAALACYGTMMVASYLIGRRKYPVDYHIGRLGLYFFTALALYGLSVVATTGNEWIDMPLRTVLLAAYVVFVAKRENLTLSLLMPHH